MSQVPALKVVNLTVAYRRGNQEVDAVRDVSLHIASGQTYGLVGESGSGKSTLALAIMRYLAGNGRVRQGSVFLAGEDLYALPPEELRGVWQDRLKLVPQNPLSSLNPSLRVGDQLVEAIPPTLVPATEARQRAMDLLATVRLADPERIARSYPHQLSGGMQQRVMIAMALAAEPTLMVLDEPTTNLDVTTEAAMLDLLRELIHQRRMAVLYVSHNLSVVAGISNRVAVMYAGEVVEDAAVEDLYARPIHPYTSGLLACIPRMGDDKYQLMLQAIPGAIPRPGALPAGCVFAPRCPLAVDTCLHVRPSLEPAADGHDVRCHRWPEIVSGQLAAWPGQAGNASTRHAVPDRPQPVLQVDNLYKRFPLGRSLKQILRRQPVRAVRAVDGISLDVLQGVTLGLVGESGSGKTTVARAIAGLVEPDGGAVLLAGVELPYHLSRRDATTLRRIQMVFQNPEEALNPYRTVEQALARPLMRLGGLSAAEAQAEVPALLESVKLSPSYANRLPGQLSGGEKQRVAIARAFASQPDLLILDESVSALDVSIQATILDLLNELQHQRQTAYLFISHDLAVTSYLSNEIAVLYLGQVIERGTTAELLEPPYHPYTEALLSAVPLPYPSAVQEPVRLAADVPSPIDLPGGCRFHTRCPRFLGDICTTEEPPWQATDGGHGIRCHIPLADLALAQRPLFAGR